MTREQLVATQMSLWQSHPYAWGQRDCVLVVADWIARWTGRDPADDIRLTYGTAGECQRATRFFTDPLACVAPRLLFLPVTDAPAAGDAVLCTSGARPFMGLSTGTFVGAFLETGQTAIMHLSTVKLLRAWEVPCDPR